MNSVEGYIWTSLSCLEERGDGDDIYKQFWQSRLDGDVVQGVKHCQRTQMRALSTATEVSAARPAFSHPLAFPSVAAKARVPTEALAGSSAARPALSTSSDCAAAASCHLR